MDTKDTRAALATLRAAIDKALLTVDPKLYGSLKLAQCSFTHSGGFTFRLEGNLPGGKSKEESQYETERMYDKSLPPLGTSFSCRGVRYVIAGAGRGGAIYCKSLDGRQWRFKRDGLIKMLAVQGEPA